VNTDELEHQLYWAERRVREIQTKLHRWAIEDPDRRFDDLYNLVCDPGFLLVAWDRVRGNKGARTAGVDGQTVRQVEAGCGVGVFLEGLRAEVKDRSFRPVPVRERMIPKPGTVKRRRLGIPALRDRVVQGALKLVLEPIFEADFLPCSYGFRPNRRAHDAMAEVRHFASCSYEWIVEGDIKACFGSLDHQVLLSTLADKIHDGRFLRLISNMLAAGYLEDWRWNATLSGAPQGGVASPILSNIYLARLDKFVEQSLLPDYNHGKKRRRDTRYQAVDNEFERAKRRGDRQAVRLLRQQRRRFPSQDPNDPDYRRLRYVRYCDDFLLGLAGPRHEAERIKSKIQMFLRDELKLELSQSETLITHAVSQAARFLGYEIRTQHANAKITAGRRSVNARIGLFVPKDVIRQRCARYMSKGKPAQLGALLHDTDYTIVAKFGSEYRGLVQYYLLAQDVFRLEMLRWVTETSMLKTLAGKHKSSVNKMAAKYKTVIDTPHGKRTCFQVVVPRDRGRKPLVAQFGGIPLKRQRTAVLTDLAPVLVSTKRNELIHRLLAGRCEICESTDRIEVHHLRKLADLNRHDRSDKPAWVHLMAKRRRKTLVICRPCHEDIHKGQSSASTRKRSLESRVSGN